MKLPTGKVPSNILQEIVFSNLGAKRGEVVVGPSYGLDGAAVEVGDKVLITSMDPITGALERIGWLAVNINANDVATFGVEPSFFSSCLLLPENATEEIVKTICGQIDLGARRLGMAVIGGHAESTPNLAFPIVVGCCMGVTERGHYVTSRGAKPGNLVILTKSAGLEGTAILAADRQAQLLRELGKSVLKEAKGFYDNVSVVKEAILAFQTGYVTAMHDPTEGGVAGGIHELADASKLGFKVYEKRMRIADETLKICDFFHIDPLQLIASGSLLIAVEKRSADEVLEVLSKGKIPAGVIGELLSSPKERFIMRRDGTTEELIRPTFDHLWLALGRKYDD